MFGEMTKGGKISENSNQIETDNGSCFDIQTDFLQFEYRCIKKMKSSKSLFRLH